MSHWHKVIIALLCAGALFYFDFKEVRNVRNNNKFSSHSDTRIRIGNSRMRSICFVATKRNRTRVICPDCQKWVRDVGKKTYSCTDSKIKKGFVFNHKGRA